MTASPTSLRYAEYPPRPDLAEHVHCVWIFEGEEERDDQRIAPDGRCELIIHFGAPYLEREASGWSRQAPVVFAGQLTRPLHLRAEGAVGVVGVRFRHAGALGFIGAPVSRFTNRRTPLNLALPPGLDEVGLLSWAQDQVAIGIAAHPAPRDAVVDQAITRIEAGLPVEASRDLQRRFARVVGVPPRMLAAILRFRSVFDALSEPGVTNWTAAAQAAGYFDHPQLARDFRRFVGCTPSQFLSQQAGLAASLAQV